MPDVLTTWYGRITKPSATIVLLVVSAFFAITACESTVEIQPNIDRPT